MGVCVVEWNTADVVTGSGVVPPLCCQYGGGQPDGDQKGGRDGTELS